jgi:hypothetical protein
VPLPFAATVAVTAAVGAVVTAIAAIAAIAGRLNNPGPESDRCHRGSRHPREIGIP